ncbi:MAG: LD-carboxypeptidase [Bacteroidales bacterium]|nr:LD-carboxypeptidase [Bacteroidales bacterium]
MKRLFISMLVLSLAFTALAQHKSANRCTIPDFLQPGDRIALISPSYHTDITNIDTAAIVLRQWGYEPVIGAFVDSLHRGSYAGDAQQRLSDIRWALNDPDVKAIICNRGGYGTIHLADMIEPGEFAAHPKWLVGFSDITTLLAMETCDGVMGIHGTIGAHIAKNHGRDTNSILLRELLEGRIPEYRLPSHPLNTKGKGTGILVGGNLCTIAPLIGTSADPTREGDIILFLEEVEESYHNIDRLFNMLILTGVIDRCKGIILGEFTDCGADLEWESPEEMICSYLKGRDIPVICGFPAGHGNINLPLIMGARTTIKVKGCGASLSFCIRGDKHRIDTAGITGQEED